MPFKSKAQRRKFAELLVNGKITPEAYERWNQETGSEKLPEYVDPKKKAQGKSKSKSTASTAKAKSAARTAKAKPKSAASPTKTKAKTAPKRAPRSKQT